MITERKRSGSITTPPAVSNLASVSGCELFPPSHETGLAGAETEIDGVGDAETLCARRGIGKHIAARRIRLETESRRITGMSSKRISQLFPHARKPLHPHLILTRTPKLKTDLRPDSNSHSPISGCSILVAG